MSIKIEGYEILEKAGGTTDTTIWTARQISLDRNVSIWVMKARAAADPNLVNHFSTITRAISRLKHNNFPPVIDISKTEDGEPYIVFENADSTSITRIIKDKGVYSVVDALKIAKEVALALDTAWKQTGLVHRNLKPDNIRIYDDGNVKIFNFNSATIVQPGTNPLAFDDGMIVGTPNYAAPEQIDCLPSIDYHADMYGLGASLYQMLTGKAPFDEERDPMKILELQRSGHLPNPKSKNPNIPDSVVYFLARLMAKSPEDRYSWWLDVVEDIEHILSNRPLRMIPPNGIVRSTIDQNLLLTTPLVVPTPVSVTPSQSPISTPIVPVVPANNTPITPEVYAETVRNFQSTAQNPISAPIIPPITINPNPVEQNASPVQKQQPEPKKQAPKPATPRSQRPSVSARLFPSRFVVLVTRLACLILFCVGVVVIIKTLGPAGNVLSEEQAQEDPATNIAPIANTYDASENVEAEVANQEIDASEFVAFEEVEDSDISSDAQAQVQDTNIEASSAKQSTQTVSNDEAEENFRDEMLRKAFNELCSKNIAEARTNIKKIFDEYASKPSVNRAECRGIINVLNAAMPETEAVGTALVKQTQIAFKEITIAGRTIEVKAYAYANGELLCNARKTGTVQTRKISIPLSKASPQEMYNILKAEPDASKEMMVTKAILALRVNNHGDFVRFSRKVKALQCFADFLE